MKRLSSDCIKSILLTLLMVFLVSAGLILAGPVTVSAKTETIAIIPFEINSQKDISFIRAGIIQMLESRLSWKDHVSVVKEKGTPGKLNSQALLKAILKKGSVLDSAGATAYDYVLNGSITEFEGAFSLDVKVFNIRDKTSHVFSNQAGTMQKIIPEIDILAARINKKIFNRKTAALEMIENNGKSIEAKREKRIRQNPEQIMNQEFGQERRSNRPFWKFWGKDSSQDGSNRPFWKFWGKKSSQDDTDNPDQGDQRENKPFWKIW